MGKVNLKTLAKLLSVLFILRLLFIVFLRIVICTQIFEWPITKISFSTEREGFSKGDQRNGSLFDGIVREVEVSKFLDLKGLGLDIVAS